jgi:methionyl-tRNA synthetase
MDDQQIVPDFEPYAYCGECGVYLHERDLDGELRKFAYICKDCAEKIKREELEQLEEIKAHEQDQKQ